MEIRQGHGASSTSPDDLIEVAADAVVRVDPAGRVLGFDAAAERILGARGAALLGRPLSELLLSGEGCQRFDATIASLTQTDGADPVGAGRVRRFELSGVRGERTPAPFEISLVATSDLTQVYCLIRDLGALRENELRLARSESLLAEAEAVAGFGSFELDLHTGRFEPSVGLRALLGEPRTRSLRTLLSCFGQRERRAFEQALGRARRGGSPFELTLPLAADGNGGPEADGGVEQVRLRARVLRGGDGQPARIVAAFQDVTEELEARNMREFLGYVVDSSHDAIFTRSVDGRITSWNRGAEQLFGYTAEEVIGNGADLMVPPGHRAAHEDQLRTVLGGQPLEAGETERVRRDGTTVTVSMSLSPVRDGTGRVVAVAAIAHDISERKRYEQRLQHMADHDPLTDLLNRRRFREALDLELERTRRYGTAGAVLSIDLDNLKQLNDGLGHAAGDALILAAAGVLRRTSRASDVVARLGGDEFGVILRVGGADQAKIAAEHLLDALRAEPLVIAGCPQRISASIGATVFGGDEADADDVLAIADIAMYEAKRAGRDRVILLSSATSVVASHSDENVAETIRRALRADGFEVHWQPIVDLKDGTIDHAELLLRLRDASGMLIPPPAFLPAAGRAGLLAELDEWVIARACASLAALPVAERLRVAVNVSAASLEAGERLARAIEVACDRSGIPPRLLIIEINEAAAIANAADVQVLADRMHRIGCALALDDFGSGFGSFRYLRHLPFDFIKLDGEFIRDVARSRSDKSLVRAIVEVARGLAIKTIAEAVPDSVTVELLRHEGVDFAQGFHLGRPRPELNGLRAGAAVPCEDAVSELREP